MIELRNNLQKIEEETFEQFASKEQKKSVEEWKSLGYKYLVYGTKRSELIAENIKDYKAICVQNEIGTVIKLFYSKTGLTKEEIRSRVLAHLSRFANDIHKEIEAQKAK